MRKYDALLQVVRECDYRVLEGPVACGCQAAEARCLMARGGWPRDPHMVNPSDCLTCIKEKEDGRVVVADPASPTRNDGITNHHNVVAGPDRGDGTASIGLVVPVVEGPLEREILRLERELQQLWNDVRVLQSFRNPVTEQGQASLFNSLVAGVPHFPSTPTGFGCDGGMPLTLNWSDSVYQNDNSGNPISLTYSTSTGCYSGSALVDVPAACGCPGATGVPITITYCITGITTTYNGDGSGCPTNGAGNPYNFGWPLPSIFNCDLSNPGNFATNPVGPSDGSGAGTNSCKMGYGPGDQAGLFGNPINDTVCYIPRTIYFRDSYYGVWTLHYTGSGLIWSGSKTINYAVGGISGTIPCPARTPTYTVTFQSTGVGFTLTATGPETVAGCPDPSGGFTSTTTWNGTKTCPPFKVVGSLANNMNDGPWNSLNSGQDPIKLNGH